MSLGREVNQCFWCLAEFDSENSDSDYPDDFCSTDCQEDYEEDK